MVKSYCVLQGQETIGVSAKNQVRIFFQQHLNHSQIAITSRIVNLTTKGKTSTSQRCQRGGDDVNFPRTAEITNNIGHFHISFDLMAGFILEKPLHLRWIFYSYKGVSLGFTQG